MNEAWKRPHPFIYPPQSPPPSPNPQRAPPTNPIHMPHSIAHHPGKNTITTPCSSPNPHSSTQHPPPAPVPHPRRYSSLSVHSLAEEEAGYQSDLEFLYPDETEEAHSDDNGGGEADLPIRRGSVAASASSEGETGESDSGVVARRLEGLRCADADSHLGSRGVGSRDEDPGGTGEGPGLGLLGKKGGKRGRSSSLEVGLEGNVEGGGDGVWERRTRRKVQGGEGSGGEDVDLDPGRGGDVANAGDGGKDLRVGLGEEMEVD
ncbi:hypothetical protein B9Z65_5460 [Elsinoe australis]|uniref:Uncharacterized protein n=1 Tax=Elsinoe australis TaxID=40998 RepID=A0A2P7ZE56_9PEZI|nr:hypothetical protein B9Z65_5460 [Elsinoe australis]